MNFTYFKFLFVTSIKRKPLWITWLIYLFLVFFFLIVLPLGAKLNFLQIWANPGLTICQSFLLIGVALLTAILSVIIFKEGNDLGTDLVVISKPLNKRQMILTKFACLGILCLLINISACLMSCFTFCLPAVEQKYYGNIFLSMFIGNIVSYAVFATLSALVSAKLNKVGVVLINVLIPVVFFVYQITAALVFTTPITNLNNHHITSNTLIVANRDDDGKYFEDHLVDFIPSTNEHGVSPLRECIDYKDVMKYWEDISTINNTVLHVTDIATQFGLSYLSTGLEKYSFQQSLRNFGLSSFYDYKLFSPASPEFNEQHKAIKWIYTGHYDTVVDPEKLDPFDVCVPLGYGFPALSASSDINLTGKLTDAIPVGHYSSLVNNKQSYVYLESDEWKKYSAGFKDMYNTIFRYDLVDIHNNPYYDLTNIEEYDYPSAWCLNNKNLSKYYDLVWGYLTNNTDLYLASGQFQKHDFNIKNVDDLNTRFIQFKYFCFNLAQEEQDNVISSLDEVNEKEILARNSAITALDNLSNRSGVVWSDNDWTMYSNAFGELPYYFLDPDSKTVAFPLLTEMLKDEHRLVGISDYDLKSCSYAKIMKCANIYNFCVSQEEHNLFGTINKQDTNKRSDAYTGNVFVYTQRWIPSLLARSLSYGQNMNLFYYDIEQNTPFYIFPLIWSLVAIAMGTFAIITYKRYDIK